MSEERRVPCSTELRVVGRGLAAGEVTLRSVVFGLVAVPTLQRLERSRRTNIGSIYSLRRAVHATLIKCFLL